MNVAVSIKILPHGEGLPLPSYAKPGDAGMDLRCAMDEVSIARGGTYAIPTGIQVAIPPGYELQIRSRSGLASIGVVVANSPGTIDSGYRGEVKVLLRNGGTDRFLVKRGDRIAQAVLAPVHSVIWDVVDTLDDTERGVGGFGSTGTE